MDNLKEKMARLSVPIEAETKRLVKIAALESNMNLQDFVLMVLTEKINNKPKRNN